MFQVLPRRRRIRIVCLVLITLLSFSVLSFASSDSSDSMAFDTSGVSQTLDRESSSEDFSDVQIVDIQNLRISPSDTSGFHAVILGLLGDYNPIAVTTAYQYPSGTGYTTRYQVDVEPDWSWICTAAVFVVIIFCLFRLVGGLFSCKR